MSGIINIDEQHDEQYTHALNTPQKKELEHCYAHMEVVVNFFGFDIESLIFKSVFLLVLMRLGGV